MSVEYVKTNVTQITGAGELAGSYLAEITYWGPESISKKFDYEKVKALDPIIIHGIELDKTDCHSCNKLEVYFKHKKQAMKFLIMSMELLSALDDELKINSIENYVKSQELVGIKDGLFIGNIDGLDIKVEALLVNGNNTSEAVIRKGEKFRVIAFGKHLNNKQFNDGDTNFDDVQFEFIMVA